MYLAMTSVLFPHLKIAENLSEKGKKNMKDTMLKLDEIMEEIDKLKQN
jgi:hypothetical protein